MGKCILIVYSACSEIKVGCALQAIEGFRPSITCNIGDNFNTCNKIMIDKVDQLLHSGLWNLNFVMIGMTSSCSFFERILI